MAKLNSLLKPERVDIIKKGDHNEVIERLLLMVKESEMVTDFGQLKDSVWERENLVSTALGLGLAIPHVRKDFLKEFVASALIIEEGVEWKALDDKPVHFAILIASPQDSHTEYLKLLAETVLMWKDRAKRKQILAAQNSLELYKQLKNASS